MMDDLHVAVTAVLVLGFGLGILLAVIADELIRVRKILEHHTERVSAAAHQTGEGK